VFNDALIGFIVLFNKQRIILQCITLVLKLLVLQNIVLFKTNKVLFHSKFLSYLKLKEEALDRILWRTRFGKGCGTVVGQTAD
jgi:hypothetical protein